MHRGPAPGSAPPPAPMRCGPPGEHLPGCPGHLGGEPVSTVVRRGWRTGPGCAASSEVGPLPAAAAGGAAETGASVRAPGAPLAPCHQLQVRGAGRPVRCGHRSAPCLQPPPPGASPLLGRLRFSVFGVALSTGSGGETPPAPALPAGRPAARAVAGGMSSAPVRRCAPKPLSGGLASRGH